MASSVFNSLRFLDKEFEEILGSQTCSFELSKNKSRQVQLIRSSLTNQTPLRSTFKVLATASVNR